ncbi:MAG: hypothetical protein HZB26_22800 [Candidatus Hydrogenedentes bacterium]|nr:hypothetical protein [Candidatus Hydrogenedentota bacterium]
MKFLALLMTALLVTVMSLSATGCRSKVTKTEKITTQVNPVSGTETVQKETTTKSKK